MAVVPVTAALREVMEVQVTVAPLERVVTVALQGMAARVQGVRDMAARPQEGGVHGEAEVPVMGRVRVQLVTEAAGVGA
jgi:hypothetical protein